MDRIAGPEKSYWRGRLSTVYLLVLISLHELIFILKTKFKIIQKCYLNEEVNCTDLPLVSIPWPRGNTAAWDSRVDKAPTKIDKKMFFGAEFWNLKQKTSFSFSSSSWNVLFKDWMRERVRKFKFLNHILVTITLHLHVRRDKKAFWKCLCVQRPYF